MKNSTPLFLSVSAFEETCYKNCIFLLTWIIIEALTCLTPYCCNVIRIANVCSKQKSFFGKFKVVFYVCFRSRNRFIYATCFTLMHYCCSFFSRNCKKSPSKEKEIFEKLNSDFRSVRKLRMTWLRKMEIKHYEMWIWLFYSVTYQCCR